VTGASSGIGAATAYELADQGYRLWLTYASQLAQAEDVAARCRQAGAADVRLSRLDLRSPGSISRIVDEFTTGWGQLHVLINNGAVCPYRGWLEISVDEWDSVMETNARGAFLLTRALLPLLKAAAPDDRSVVNISSIAGQIGSLKTGLHYAASKGALLAITRSLARMLADERIRVNAVCPGPVNSMIAQQLDSPERAELAASVPLGRFGEGQEVASVVALLASPTSSFVTGATYDVNGGLNMR
jgi:3-oxoacyl-[acyl-carrier protein] reductase